MAEIKNIIGIFAVLLVFLGYIPYLRDILKGKTKPHVYSWFLWGFVTFIVFTLQISDKAGAGAFVSLAASLMCFVVISLGFVKRDNKMDITASDTIFFILAFISLAVWLIAKQPLLSTLLAMSTDLLGFVPTIRKSWNKPFSETLSMYGLNTFRFALAVIAIQHYSLITTLYPAAWLVSNGLFAGMLMVRRKQVKKGKYKKAYEVIPG